MKEIVWTIVNEDVLATVGSVRMRCYKEINSTTQWRAKSCYSSSDIYGPLRNCLQMAKEDAVRLSRELLVDHKVSLNVELANFDLQEI